MQSVDKNVTASNDVFSTSVFNVMFQLIAMFFQCFDTPVLLVDVHLVCSNNSQMFTVGVSLTWASLNSRHIILALVLDECCLSLVSFSYQNEYESMMCNEQAVLAPLMKIAL